MEVALSTENIWVNIFVPIIIGPIFLMVKVLYDRWDFKKKETVILKNKLNLEKINGKLQQFYWPLYILLLKDFNLWSNLKLKETEPIEITESDSDSDCEGYNLKECQRCSYVKKSVDGTIIPCRNLVAKNCTTKNKTFCIKHLNLENNKLLEIINPEFGKKEVTETIKQEIINYSDVKNEQVVINIEGITDSDSSESLHDIIANNTDSLPGNITGNNIGEISGLNVSKSHSGDSIEMKSIAFNSVIEEIIQNHQKISDIITNNISIAEPKSYIGRQFVKFLKFATIFKTLYNSEKRFVSPTNYGASYPKKLLPLVEIEVFNLQKSYNQLVNDYYKF